MKVCEWLIQNQRNWHSNIDLMNALDNAGFIWFDYKFSNINKEESLLEKTFGWNSWHYISYNPISRLYFDNESTATMAKMVLSVG